MAASGATRCDLQEVCDYFLGLRSADWLRPRTAGPAQKEMDQHVVGRKAALANEAVTFSATLLLQASGITAAMHSAQSAHSSQ